MTKEKTLQYKKAYVQLYEIIKALPEEIQNKIPNEVIKNIIENKDNNYVFKLDFTKTLLEQDLMIETKALLIQIYAKYLALDIEKEKWEKYNKICINKIEEEKRKQYNPNDIFSKKEENKSQKEWALVECKQSIFRKILNRIKKIFHKNEWYI